MLFVVVNYQTAVDGEHAAIIAQEREGVDIVGRNVDVAGYYQTYVVLGALGDSYIVDNELLHEFSRLNVAADGAAIVVPLRFETRFFVSRRQER